MKFIIAQLIGAIAYFILSMSYFKKEKKEIMFMQIFSSIFFALHYYLLSGITAIYCNILNLIAIVIIYLFELRKGKNKKLLIGCIIPFLVVISLLSYQNVFSIFPIIASIITLALFCTDNENWIRVAGIISALCWLIYACVYKSYIGIGFELYTVIATAIAWYKYNRKLKKV